MEARGKDDVASFSSFYSPHYPFHCSVMCFPTLCRRRGPDYIEQVKILKENFSGAPKLENFGILETRSDHNAGNYDLNYLREER